MTANNGTNMLSVPDGNTYRLLLRQQQWGLPVITLPLTPFRCRAGRSAVVSVSLPSAGVPLWSCSALPSPRTRTVPGAAHSQRLGTTKPPRRKVLRQVISDVTDTCWCLASDERPSDRDVICECFVVTAVQFCSVVFCFAF